jgi:hypothetical protein
MLIDAKACSVLYHSPVEKGRLRKLIRARSHGIELNSCRKNIPRERLSKILIRWASWQTDSPIPQQDSYIVYGSKFAPIH